MNPEDKSKIEELKKSLYSRNAPDIRTKRRLRFTRPDMSALKTDWEHKEEGGDDPQLNKHYIDHSMSFFTKLLIGSTLFFLVAVGIGTYLVLRGSNIVSANNIDITISGPVSVAGGAPISLDMQVYNKNKVKLQNVNLEVDFPAGTVDPTNSTKQLNQYQVLLDDISPGGVGQKNVNAVIYGEENSKKEVTVTVSYQISGSNAIFQKEKTFDILISSAPLTISVDSYKEITSGQTFDTAVTLTSNSQDVLKNLILKATYPLGFTFISSDMKAERDNATWDIGDVPPGATKTIHISGKLEGQDGEDKIIHFAVGAQSTADPLVISTQYVDTTQDITIQKPFVTVGISLGGDDGTGDYVGTFDKPVTAQVSWFNNLPTSIIDGEIHVKLSGNAFDKSSVTPNDGYYDSINNEIIWSKQTTPSLANISAGGSGSLSFTFTPRNLGSSSKQIINPSISISVDALGNRISESNVPESITSSAVRNVKISSNLALSAEVARIVGPFQNTGPIPPIAEKPTTYTIIWTVDNTANTVSGAKVTATLPPYVKWLSKSNPVSEDISYNSNNGQVTWNIGNVDTYTQSNSHERQVSFQIEFDPSVAEVGQSVNLIGQTVLTAQDDFTGENLTDTTESLTTRFDSDPSFKDGQDIVGKQ